MEFVISIIIVNYNTFDITSKCIQSIISETRLPYEIILIDNNSSEPETNSFPIIFPSIKFIQLSENIGFARANNLGMEKASSKYILLLNSDTIILDSAIDKCVELIQLKNNIDVLGCNLLYEDFSNQSSFYYPVNDDSLKVCVSKALKNNIILRYLFNSKPKEKNYSGLKRVEALSGAFILLKREVFEKTGGFDPDFFMYCEDTEWFRNRMKGRFNVFYYGEPKVIHLKEKSNSSKVNFQNIISYYLYWYKIGKLHFWMYSIISLSNSLIKFLISTLLLKKNSLKNEWIILSRLFPLILLNITKYDNKFASRPNSFKLNKL